MSRYNRPMRRWKPEPIACGRCGEPIYSDLGGWRHVKFHPITSPDWHVASPATNTMTPPELG